VSKPEKIRYSHVSVAIDGIVTKRIQTVTVNTDTPKEQSLELANSGAVEWIDGTPTVNVTLDTNDVGSTDTLALLTDKMFTYVSGKSPEAGPRNHADYGMKYYIRAASSNAAYRNIDELDLLNGYSSLLVTINQDGTAAARTMWLNHCAVTGFSLSYDVNGNAAENYTLVADNKTWYANQYKDVRAYKCETSQIRRTYEATSIAFINLGSSIPSGSTVVAVAFNSEIAYMSNTMWECTSDNPAVSDGQAASSFSLYYRGTPPLSTPFVSTASNSLDRATIIYAPITYAATWEATAVSNWNPGYELESTSGAIGVVRRGQVVAYLWNTQGPAGRTTYTSSGKALRLQSVSIDVALSEEQLFELGKHGFYGISKNTPVPVTVNCSFTDSDLQYFAMLGSTSEATEKEITLNDFNDYNSLKLMVYADKTQATLLKTIDINKMSVQSENFSVNVGANATHEISFLADNVNIYGSGVNVTGGWFGAL